MQLYSVMQLIFNCMTFKWLGWIFFWPNTMFFKLNGRSATYNRVENSLFDHQVKTWSKRTIGWLPQLCTRGEVETLVKTRWVDIRLVSGANCSVGFLQSIPAHSFLLFWLVSIILLGDNEQIDISSSTLARTAKKSKHSTTTRPHIEQTPWHDGMFVITTANDLPHEIETKRQLVYQNLEINGHRRQKWTSRKSYTRDLKRRPK